MSLLDTASLIVTPNGYKEGKLYSVIPSDGSGDLSVTRATTATRVNSAGLVELVPYNLFTYSEQFNNADWQLFNSATITANSTTAPNGTLTADTLNLAANASSSVYQSETLIAGSYTISVYAKTASGTKKFRLRADAPTAIESSDFTATTEWQRFEFTFTSAGGTGCYVINETAGTAGSIYIWGAQLVEGSTAKDYQKTETRLNIPRLDYSNGTCPSLLVEPQRTNFTRNNNNLSGWVETIPADTITLNAGISPDGNSNAIKIIPSTTYGAHMIYDDTTNASSGGNFTMSCYAKASGYSKIGLRESASVGYYATFNLANGTIIDNGGNNASIVDMGNGWYRCIVSVAFSGNVNMGIIALNDAYTSGQPYFPYEFAGNGTSGVLIYGPQLETSASYATSLISTAGVSSATRNADVISKTGISSLIGQTEGTIFLDLQPNNTGSVNVPIRLDDTTSNNRIQFEWSGATTANLLIASGGSWSVLAIGISLVQNQHSKIAIGYKANDFVLYVNGSSIYSNTSGAVPVSLTSFRFNESSSNVFSGDINAAALWKTRLTNTQLAQLTTI